MNKNTIKAPCTVLLAVVNVIVFLVLSFQGMTEDGRFMLQHGAMYVPYLIKNGEYYRLFTSMFLHFGYDHRREYPVCMVGHTDRKYGSIGRRIRCNLRNYRCTSVCGDP